MRKPHHLSHEYWNSLSDGQQELYAAVRPMPKAAQALDCRLAEVENFIEWNAQGVKDLGGELELEPDFQRGHVWTDAQRSAYIESLMRKAAPVALSFNCPGWCDPSTGEGDIPDNLMQCIDGLQRLTAVRKYVAGQLRVFGGRTVEDFKGSPFDPARYSLKFLIFQFEHRVDLLQFYLDINNGGSRHEESELERVRNLLRAAQCHEAAPFALEG